MAKLHMRGNVGARAMAQMLGDTIVNSAMTCDLVDQTYDFFNGLEVCVLVFEKYYMRASNRASLTVVVSGGTNWSTVSAISAGGGQGPIFKFSWGAEEDFLSVVEELLSEHGYRDCDQ